MRETSTPRLALARDLVRCAVLEVDATRQELMVLAETVYAMSDSTFEEIFLDVVADRDTLFRYRDLKREIIRCRYDAANS